MSCAEKSRYLFPSASVKWQSSASTTWTGFHPFWRRQVPYVYFVVICFTSAEDKLGLCMEIPSAEIVRAATLQIFSKLELSLAYYEIPPGAAPSGLRGCGFR